MKKTKLEDIKLLQFFMKFAYKYKWNYLIAFMLMPILAYLSILGPSFVKKVIDIGLVNNDLFYVARIAWVYLGITLLIFLFTIFQNIFLQIAGLKSLRDIRGSLVKHILSLSRRDYESNPSGVYVSRSISDIENIGETFLQGVTYLLTDCLMIIAIIIYIAFENFYLGIVTLLGLPILLLILNWFRVNLRIIFNKIREINAKLTTNVNETFMLFDEIEAFNLAPVMLKKIKNESDEYEKYALKSIKFDSWLYSIFDGLLFVAIGFTMYLATFIISNESFSLGLFAAYILLLEKLFSPLKEMSGRFAILQSALAAINKVNNIFELPFLDNKGVDNIEMKEFKLNNVYFSYDLGNDIIKGISLKILANQSLGIVGSTGSGKTTLIKLLMRHYLVERGEILIDGIDINKLSLSAFKNKMVLIPQEPSIFSKDIFFNIALNRPEITEKDVEKICQTLKLDDFISRLPQGYKTILENKGKDISAGQRQLIALARAFISKANTIIFDEATANIDTQSELLIQQTLKIIMGEKTVITIAHRLSTIRDCDNIIVLKAGTIIEQGKHKDLLDNKGLYYHLLQIQKEEK